MKFAVVICVLLSLIAVNKAAISKGKYNNSAHPNKCAISEKVILSPGESAKAPNNPCASVTCLANGQVEFKPCPAVAPEKGCKLRDFVNTERPYPACCERTYDCTKKI